jgi:hypothetical protein
MQHCIFFLHASMEAYSAHCKCLLSVQVALRVTESSISVNWVEESSVSKEIATSYVNNVQCESFSVNVACDVIQTYARESMKRLSWTRSRLTADLRVLDCSILAPEWGLKMCKALFGSCSSFFSCRILALVIACYEESFLIRSASSQGSERRYGADEQTPSSFNQLFPTRTAVRRCPVLVRDSCVAFTDASKRTKFTVVRKATTWL